MRHTWEDPHKSNGCETKVHGQSVVMRSDDDISGGPWSSCSKTDFEAHYLQNKDNWCMEGIVCINCLFLLRFSKFFPLLIGNNTVCSCRYLGVLLYQICA